MRIWIRGMAPMAIVLLGAAVASPSAGPAAKSATAPTIASDLDVELSFVERDVINAADAMPAERYSFAPTNGNFSNVRDFGEQLKHIAAANEVFYSLMLGRPVPAYRGGDLNTKGEIIRYLRHSFALGHEAVKSITPENALQPIPNAITVKVKTRVGMAAWASAHSYDIYGQLVEYLRMNGIVPPASVSK